MAEGNWLQDFTNIMAGATDVVRNVVDTIDAVKGKNLPSPVGVATLQVQAQEAEAVQGEQRVPGPAAIDVSGWLPILAVVVVLILVVKS